MMKERRPMRGPGWVYALSGFGAQRNVIKIGSTRGLPFERASFLIKTLRPKCSGPTELYASLTFERFGAEQKVKAMLSGYQSREVYTQDIFTCRELYKAPLGIVLSAIKEATSRPPERFANWQETKRLVDAMRKRADWAISEAWHARLEEVTIEGRYAR